MKNPKLAGLIGLFLSLVFGVLWARSQAKDDSTLNQVLKQMETVGKTFRSFAAHFTQKTYWAVLKEFDTPEAGELDYARAQDGSALIRQEFTKPGVRILTIKGGAATLYQPSLKLAQFFNLGKNKNKAEYLVLGIGQSPAKMQETFNIQYQGTEPVNGDPCSVLVLKPKNPSVAGMFSMITLWVKKSSGIPIQDKLQEPTGSYTLITFSDEKLNQKIPDSKFEQKLPPDVERQVIQ